MKSRVIYFLPHGTVLLRVPFCYGYRSATGTVLLRSSWHQNAQHSWHQNAQLAPERTGGLHSEMLYILLSVAAAANVALPASASGTLHVLLLGSKPVARSYDGHAC